MTVRCFTIFKIDKYSINFCIIHLLNSLYYIYIFSNFFCLIQRKYDMPDISLSKFLDALPAFTCERAIGNL